MVFHNSCNKTPLLILIYNVYFNTDNSEMDVTEAQIEEVVLQLIYTIIREFCESEV
jgi:hypothetical protein